MANLLKSLVLLSLLFGFATARLSTVNRYGTYKGGGSPPIKDEQDPPKPKDKRRPPPAPKVEQETPPLETDFLGSWKIHSENAGVSAMHIQLMPNNNKAVWYDTTNNGLSEIESNPRICTKTIGGHPKGPQEDCTAHAIEYDIETAEIRTLQMTQNPWCSSGGLSSNGALVSTGGVFTGFKSVRILQPCENCDFQEKQNALHSNRWYATQHPLENGSLVVLGGSHSLNYEIIAAESLDFKPKLFALPFLDETDEAPGENNLYPFVNLLPDGNLFVFANDKSIVLDPYTGKEVHRFPNLPGGVRNYPPSAMSALLPIDLTMDNEDTVNVEVLICGGNTHESYYYSDRKRPREFLPALHDCGRLSLTKRGEQWDIEDMPSPRVMGDLLVLPTGDMLMINGAKAGTSAWNAADIPNLTPVLYSPDKPKGQRFKVLTASTIPRMYHSVSAVLPDGQILVAGSNTNEWYMREKPKDVDKEFSFPTELRVEKFSPPYLAPELQDNRLEILEEESDNKWNYGGVFNLRVRSSGASDIDTLDIKVTMYSPPFTTHGYSMNQRLLILKVKRISSHGKISVVAPPSGRLAPPGYYLVFVVHREVPSRGMWVQIQ
ncbi:hypothetical protein ACJIZ3_024486 [Penstemon smallii]|uniref:Galactose oxidase n=1 Tax=Penstemon smallii TaxID=265156 RepID=A0ABD3TSX7_9LAMI